MCVKELASAEINDIFGHCKMNTTLYHQNGIESGVKNEMNKKKMFHISCQFLCLCETQFYDVPHRMQSIENRLIFTWMIVIRFMHSSEKAFARKTNNNHTMLPNASKSFIISVARLCMHSVQCPKAHALRSYDVDMSRLHIMSIALYKRSHTRLLAS